MSENTMSWQGPRRAMAPYAVGEHVAQHVPRAVALLITLLLVVSGFVAASSAPAHAAPGDPFDPNEGAVFIAQGAPTQLYKAVTTNGELVFTPEGPIADRAYNALGFNLNDNYLYAIRDDSGLWGLQRIGQGGVVTSLGTVTGLPNPGGAGYNQGTFGSGATANTLYVRRALFSSTELFAIDVTTRVATAITLSAPVPNITDIVWKSGHIWGVHSDGTIYRINPTTGVVRSWPTGLGLPTGSFGAQWVYGNGNLGISHNATGTVYQIAIANPTSLTPTFTLVSAVSGPGSSNNDGAAAPGGPVDLALDKTAELTDPASREVTYSLTVTNNGPGRSSGSVVTDALPAELTNVTPLDPACSVASGTLTCAVSALTSGTSTSFSFTAIVAAGFSGTVSNTASVTGNEADPTPGNNADTADITIIPPTLNLEKSGAFDPATNTITYTFTVSRTGNVGVVTGITIDETSFSGTGTLSAIACADTDLAPGESTTCTATYQPTTADLNAQVVDNVAVAKGSYNGSPVVSPQDAATVPLDGQPSLEFDKSSDVQEVTAAGDTIVYTYTATNTGNVTLTDVTVTETAFSGTNGVPALDCPADTSIDPGESFTCTASYVVSQEDIDAGSIVNVANAGGTGPGGVPVSAPEDSVTVHAVADPALDFVKSSDKTTVAAAGETVTYAFTATNTGNITLSDVVVTEGSFSGTGTLSALDCPTDTTLAPGETFVCTATYTVTQQDIDAGTITNTATASGTTPGGEPVDGPEGTVTIDAPAAPELDFAKTSDKTSVAAPGETVTYTFTATNVGNVTLDDVVVSEGSFSGTGALSALDCPADTSIAPGESFVCTATYTVTAEDIDAGGVTNTASATGTPPGGEPVDSPEGSVTVTASSAPALEFSKTSDVTEVQAAGDVITYTFTATNTGNITLSDVVVTEGSFSGTGTLSALDCPTDTTLAPGESLECTATYTVTAEDVVAGSIANTASASGTTPGGDPVESPEAEVTVPVNPVVALALEFSKTSDVTEVQAAGDVITYTFTATNTGNVTLSDVVITEGSFSGTGALSALECPADTTLVSGESLECTATYTVTQQDVDAGGVTNTASATGTPPGGGPITSPEGSVTVTAPPAPELEIEKSSDTAVVTAAGDTITYAFVATNTGNVTLSGVSVAEGSFSGTGTLSEIVCGATTTLAPGESLECTATYEVTAEDILAGSITNTATASGTPPTGDPVTSPEDTVTVVVPDAPGLDFVKTADRDEVKAAGDVITYTFTATNTGNVALDNVTITEGTFSGTGELSALDCPAESTLAPGASLVCTATYTLTQADIDAGGVTNTASATGNVPGGDPIESPVSEVNVPSVPAPALQIQKTSDVEVADTVGDVVTYTFVATNTGNVTLTDVSIAEGEFTGSGTLSALECSDDTTLAPGETLTCTATYAITEADLIAGSISNTATASGTTPGGDPVKSPEDKVTVPTPGAPALQLVKTSNVDAVSKVGDEVLYSFEITNTGNVTVEGISINESEFGGAGELGEIECATTTLAPGESVTCTATYVVVEADLTGAPLVNTATATGTVPGGEPVESTPSTVEVATSKVPGQPTPGPTPEPTPGTTDSPEPSVADILARTGGTLGAAPLAVGVLLLLVGAGLVIARRRQRS